MFKYVLVFKSVVSEHIMLDKLFLDKRILTGLIGLWTIVITGTFGYILYVDDSPFFHFGPNEHVALMGVPIDTWFKWTVVASYTFFASCFADFVSDAIGPFITNTIQDHKTVYIPYSKTTCLLIVQIFTVYAVLMSMISLFVALTQIDFLFIRISADLLVNWYTTHKFLENKETNADAYAYYMQNGHYMQDDSRHEFVKDPDEKPQPAYLASPISSLTSPKTIIDMVNIVSPTSKKFGCENTGN